MDSGRTYDWLQPKVAFPNHTEIGGEVVLTWYRETGQIRLGVYTGESGWIDVLRGEIAPPPDLWCPIKSIPNKFMGSRYQDSNFSS